MTDRRPYIEIGEAQRTLNHIYDSMEFAHASIAIGIPEEINKNYTVKEVIEIQFKVCNKLEEAMELLTDLIGAHAEPNENLVGQAERSNSIYDI